jgi:acetyl esterase/lipase
MNPEKNWHRNIWNQYAHYENDINPSAFEHYPSVPYSDDENDEMRIMCLSIPKGKKDFPTIVWFHGGGFTGDSRECPKELYESKEYAIAEVRYRLSPDVEAPAFYEDGVEALVWILKNIKSFGGNTDKIFIGGMSAGANLAMLISMNEKWLKQYGFDNKKLAGILAVSGQVTTHFHVAEKLKLPPESEYAPLQYLSKDLPPIIIITGDTAKDIPGRAEENVRMATMLHKLGHQNIECHSVGGKDHGGAFLSSGVLLVPFINRILLNKNA